MVNRLSILIVWIALLITPQQATAASKPPLSIPEDALFLKVSTIPNKVYVQSQLVYTLQFFRAVEISGASLTDLQTSAADAVIERLGEDQNFESQQDGKRYQVVERRYAIFPQRSGILTILPVHLEAHIPKNGHGANTLQDQGGKTANMIVQRHSPQLLIEVEPIPAIINEQLWLPARHLQLEEKWSENPPKFQVGKALTRTLTLYANGLTAAQLPELFDTAATNGTATPFSSQTDQTDSAQLHRYPDQPILTDQRKRDGIVGERRETITMIPSSHGILSLPAIEIPWWNIDIQRKELAYLPKRTLIVTTAASKETPETPETPAFQDISPTNPAQNREDSVEQEEKENTCGYTVSCLLNTFSNLIQGWKPASVKTSLLTLFFALAWLITLLSCWTRNQSLSANRASLWSSVWVWLRRMWLPFQQPQKSQDELQKQERLRDLDKLVTLLKRTCLQNNAAKCRALILTWAQSRWPEHHLRNLNDVNRLLTAQHEEACRRYFSLSKENNKRGKANPQGSFMDQHLEIATLAQEIIRLNQALFSPNPEPWKGEALWNSVQAIHSMPMVVATQPTTKTLPHLYPS